MRRFVWFVLAGLIGVAAWVFWHKRRSTPSIPSSAYPSEIAPPPTSQPTPIPAADAEPKVTSATAQSAKNGSAAKKATAKKTTAKKSSATKKSTPKKTAKKKSTPKESPPSP